MTTTVRTLRIAAVQPHAELCQVERNLLHTETLVAQAAAAGAELVVLPELFATGFVPNAALWDCAEAAEGRTTQWLSALAARFSIYLGGGLCVAEGEDFYNDWLLCTPTGAVAGRARKANAEAYCFRRDEGRHVIDTSIGRIGVGICADNHMRALPLLYQQEAVDFVLMPHAWPVPARAAGAIKQEDVQVAQADMLRLAPLYAELLGVPAVFANLSGPIAPMSGILGMFLRPDIYHLAGGSQIIDANGTRLAALQTEPGWIAADITLDPECKRRTPPPDHGGWVREGSAISRKLLVPLDITLGKWSYKHSTHRRGAARRIVAATKNEEAMLDH
jgi:N-carbamoylputrescine amidase